VASLSYQKDRRRWRVTVYLGRHPDGRKNSRYDYFKTREDAEVFMEANGLTLGVLGGQLGNAGGGGRAPRTREQVLAVIAERTRVDANGCHVWTDELTNAGYARLTWRQPDGTLIAGGHRIAFFLAHGDIPEGLVIDHLCRVRDCVNVKHLDLVTQRENVMRSPIAPGALNAAKTHCPQNHPYDEANTIVQVHRNGTTLGRLCRACQRERYLKTREQVSA
jgi:hypothetical protein